MSIINPSSVITLQTAVFILCLLSYPLSAETTIDNIALPTAIELPDMAVIDDVRERKATFLNFLHPLAVTANNKIQAERAWLIQVADRLAAGEQLNLWQWALLDQLRLYYRVDLETSSAAFFDEMLMRVDTIPVSLVLAQAATESGWGTSRFAVAGNNLFGQWCFSAGCGLVPLGRDAGAKHEVRVFASINDSIAAYLRNINTHYRYQPLRVERARQRSNREPLSSVALAQGLASYSSRGQPYIEELRVLIEQNNLQAYDLALAGFYPDNRSDQ